MRLAAAIAVVAMFGCDSAPANPTWNADVKPIFHANCGRCHGPILRGGAPSNIYLYGQAAGFGPFAVQFVEAEIMPPTTPLSDIQIETIATWVDNGTPLGDPVGSQPTLELVEPLAAEAGGAVTFQYNLDDADFDIASGTLFASIDGAEEVALLPPLISGQFAYRTETGAAAGAVVVMRAEITDGDDQVVGVDLGAITIPGAATGGSQ